VAFYECVFIVRPDISSQYVDDVTEQMSGIVSENGGQIVNSESWGIRSLAYRIKKNRKGHYILLNIDAPPQALEELKRNMVINEDIIRHLVIRVEQLSDKPSPMASSRSAKEEKSRRERQDQKSERDFSDTVSEDSAEDEQQIPASSLDSSSDDAEGEQEQQIPAPSLDSSSDDAEGEQEQQIPAPSLDSSSDDAEGEQEQEHE